MVRAGLVSDVIDTTMDLPLVDTALDLVVAVELVGKRLYFCLTPVCGGVATYKYSLEITSIPVGN